MKQNSKVQPSAPPIPDNNITSEQILKESLLQQPTFEKIQRNDDDDDEDYNKKELNPHKEHEEEKICRICLEEDHPERMIAPCRCKGGSKWVHRECLDEWRINEKDRAFSKCTECLFEYYLQPIYKSDGDDDEEDGEEQKKCCMERQQRRKVLFCMMVSRDACFGIILQQMVVVFLGIGVWMCDSDQELLRFSYPSLSFPISATMMGVCYYGLGWFAFLILLGVYGLIIMCLNGCDLERAIPQVGPPSEASSSNEASRPDYFQNHGYEQQRQQQRGHRYAPAPTASPSTAYYRRARRRHYYYHGYDCYYCPDCYPMYVYPTGNHGCCCCCCDSNGPPVNNISGNSGGADCELCCCIPHSSGSSSDCNGQDFNHVLVIILLVVAIILAVIGFFVGVVVIVVAVQRIVGRHVYLLQKRQLVREFQVMDLQEYDLDKPIAVAPLVIKEDEETGGLSGNADNENGGGGDGCLSMEPTTNMKYPVPSAPPMPADDAAYLRKLGLKGS